jgi:hypothetical protein
MMAISVSWLRDNPCLTSRRCFANGRCFALSPLGEWGRRYVSLATMRVSPKKRSSAIWPSFAGLAFPSLNRPATMAVNTGS